MTSLTFELKRTEPGSHVVHIVAKRGTAVVGESAPICLMDLRFVAEVEYTCYEATQVLLAEAGERDAVLPVGTMDRLIKDMLHMIKETR